MIFRKGLKIILLYREHVVFHMSKQLELMANSAWRFWLSGKTIISRSPWSLCGSVWGSIPHGDSEFFLFPMLVTRRKKTSVSNNLYVCQKLEPFSQSRRTSQSQSFQMRYLVFLDSDFFAQGRVLSARWLRRKRFSIEAIQAKTLQVRNKNTFLIWPD